MPQRLKVINYRLADPGQLQSPSKYVLTYVKNQSNHIQMFEKEDLLRLAKMPMPFGKYKGRVLIDLPEPYLVWFANKGFPEGQLGELLQLALEIKINGLEHLVQPLKKMPTLH